MFRALLWVVDIYWAGCEIFTISEKCGPLPYIKKERQWMLLLHVALLVQDSTYPFKNNFRTTKCCKLYKLWSSGAGPAPLFFYSGKWIVILTISTGTTLPLNISFLHHCCVQTQFTNFKRSYLQGKYFLLTYILEYQFIQSFCTRLLPDVIFLKCLESSYFFLSFFVSFCPFPPFSHLSLSSEKNCLPYFPFFFLPFLNFA